MTDQLAGKIVLVTAAAQGIGRAIANAAAAAGATVWATDINAGALGGQPADVAARPLNVLDASATNALVAEIGRIDVLVNCAGMVQSGTVLDSDEAAIDLGFDLNVKSMHRTIGAVLPGMLDRGDGAIVNIASVVSSIKGAPSRCVYGLTKGAVIGLTKSVAADYVTRGIRCNAICPGTVESPSLEQRLHAQGDYAAARAAFVARQPMGRIGRPEEVADLAVYLMTATYTTGQVHIIDGGWTT